MKLFQISFTRLVGLLLPTFLRKPLITAFLQSAVFPVSRLHTDFSTNRKINLNDLQINGQVCRLRYLLNLKFPEAGNQITITDGIQQGVWQYAWHEDLVFNHYLLIEETLFWSTAAIIQDIGGFTVNVPPPLTPGNSRHQIIHYLNTYKLPGKTYTINYYKTISL